VDLVFAYLGMFVGYSSVALVAFSIAFVLAKTLKKTWPYKVALIFSAIFYILIIIGYQYAERNN
jgi:hypothetical protein